MRRLIIATATLVLGALLTAPSAGASVGADEPALEISNDVPTSGEAPPQMAEGVIVKRAATINKADLRGAVADALEQPVGAAQPVTSTIAAYRTSEVLDATSAVAAAEAVAAQPGVEWAEPNWIVRPAAEMPTPINDEYSKLMLNIWDRREANDPTVAGIRVTPWPAGGYSSKAAAAWPATTGAGVVVAVLDTGILAHPDLAGQVLPGYDMVSADSNGGFVRANDGNGRDADVTDPGDWTTAGLCGPGLPAAPSSWHGTAVSGAIAAAMNNGIGIAGVAPSAKILPVRVLGRCGGTEADAAAGLIWATGGTVPGVPVNRNPAKIVNMSLGAASPCSSVYASAVASARSRGASIIASAGNDNAAVGSPANCPGVMGIAATSPYGDRATYSNYGSQIALSAMGGEMAEGDPYMGSLLLSNNGTTSATTMDYHYMVGTSFAAPVVAGGAALIMSSKGALPPDTMRAELQAATAPFPTALSRWSGFSTCTTSICGAGILDLSKLVPSVTSPPVLSGEVRPGAVLTATTGTWAGPPTVPGVTWLIDGTPVAEGLTYQLGVGDVGKMVSALAHGSPPFATIGARSEDLLVGRAPASMQTKFKARKAKGPGKKVRFVNQISGLDVPAYLPSGSLRFKLVKVKKKRVVAKGRVILDPQKAGRVAFKVKRVRKGKYQVFLTYSGDAVMEAKRITKRIRVR